MNIRAAGVSVTAASLLVAWLPMGLEARQELDLTLSGGETVEVPLEHDRGYAAFPARALESLGWSLRERAGAWVMERGPLALRLIPGRPLVAWGVDQWVQLVDAPYVENGELHVPLQLASDVLPDRLPDAFRSSGPFDLASSDARAAESAVDRGPLPFVVVIDAGHGGDDPGAMGPAGTREKDVALGVALELARALEGEAGVEVHLTRDRDVLVPLWERGELATRLKGDRPGIFVSIHANALPSRSVRGVETYFLSEARTDHERRVAALENAPIVTSEGPSAPEGDLGFILNELRNHDHLHWSAELAVLVQRHVAEVHPGPDRGVKQAPFAVITNALMPAVLIETGFITHPGEEGVLSDAGFQRDTAGALARAILEFSRRYPPRTLAEPGGRP